jgi:hypothetical protein
LEKGRPRRGIGGNTFATGSWSRQLEQLLGSFLPESGPSAVANPKGHHEVRKKLAYFRQHRERMRYWEYEAARAPHWERCDRKRGEADRHPPAAQAGMKCDRDECRRGSALAGRVAEWRTCLTCSRGGRRACLQAASAFYEALQTAA